MITVYVTTPGAKIYKEGDTLKVRKGDTVYHTIFPFRTEQIVVFGGVEITWRAMLELLKHGITTVFLNKNGHYNGRLVSPYDQNVLLRRMQYKMLDDHDKCLRFCRAIVIGKMKNQLVVLQRIGRFRKVTLKREINDLKSMIKKAGTADDIQVLRGYEGVGARIYFSVFDRGFTTSQGFKKRIRRPPTDPVNALLSFLYTILFNRIDGVVEREGLDPYVGVFHATVYGRRSLSLDLMEEFRPMIVDTLVFSLLNLNIVKADDFRKVDKEDKDYSDFFTNNETEQPDILSDRMGVFSLGVDKGLITNEMDGVPSLSLDDDGHAGPEKWQRPVLLKPSALRKVIEQLERKLESTFSHPIENKEMTYREAINTQVKTFLKFLRGELDDYYPLIMS